MNEKEAREIVDNMLGGWKKPVTIDGKQVFISTEEQHQRDTHFAGFAQVLMREIFVETEPRNWSELIAQAEPIIARRAYDLVKHTIENVSIADLDMLPYEEIPERIPDLTELPE